MTSRLTLQELKRQVKETWPEVKNLADAKREELTALIDRGDAELFKECTGGQGKAGGLRRGIIPQKTLDSVSVQDVQSCQWVLSSQWIQWALWTPQARTHRGLDGRNG